jgi:hypothetical protein
MSRKTPSETILIFTEVVMEKRQWLVRNYPVKKCEPPDRFYAAIDLRKQTICRIKTAGRGDPAVQ